VFPQTAELVSSQLRAGGIAHARPTQWRALTEIEVGRCDGLTYDQIYRQFPQDWAARAQDKLRFTF
jgi:broad specificity phosphatase PhoE